MTRNFYAKAAEDTWPFPKRECTTCLEEKPLSKFYKLSPLLPDDYEIRRRSICIPCYKKVNSEYNKRPEVAADRARRNREIREELDDFRDGLISLDIPSHKVCRTCEIDKPIDRYALSPTADYHRVTCKDCNTAQRNQYHETPEGKVALVRRREAAKKFQERNRDVV